MVLHLLEMMGVCVCIVALSMVLPLIFHTTRILHDRTKSYPETYVVSAIVGKGGVRLEYEFVRGDDGKFHLQYETTHKLILGISVFFFVVAFLIMGTNLLDSTKLGMVNYCLGLLRVGAISATAGCVVNNGELSARACLWNYLRKKERG